MRKRSSGRERGRGGTQAIGEGRGRGSGHCNRYWASARSCAMTVRYTAEAKRARLCTELPALSFLIPLLTSRFTASALPLPSSISSSRRP